MSKETNKTEKKPIEAKMLYVCDSNQEGDKPRIHEVPVKTHPSTNEVLAVKKYPLYSDPSKAVEMPEAHAMFFTRDEAFVVLDKDGTRIEPVRVKDINVGRIVLGENEIIVQYEELTQEALFKRCKINSGSGFIKAKTKKSIMIEFLKKVSGIGAHAIGVSKGSEHVIQEMGADQLDNMLDSSPQGAAVNRAVNPAINQVALHN